MKKQIYSVIAVNGVLLLMLSIFNSCIQEETFAKATVETSQVISVTEATATCGGIISADGGSDVTVCGVCWSTLPNPTVENDTTVDDAGTVAFTSLIKGLSPGTTYYVRAYASNKGGTGYGLQMIFTTKSGVIGLITSDALAITALTATSGGAITSDGGVTVTARGVCWSTSSNPTIANSKTIDGTGLGSFTSSITGLSANTLYYVRAYAINSVGTAYGNQQSFTTSNAVTDIDGNVYSTVTIGTQEWMAENLRTTKYNDGTSIPYVTVFTAWAALSTPGYCFYNNDDANKSTYGALYNWYTVNTGKLAPTGWHVPTDAEWTTLTTYLINNGYGYGGSGSLISKSMASTSGWTSFSTEGTVGNDQTSNNRSGFAGFPGGSRGDNGAFYDVGSGGYWWSSTEHNASIAWLRDLDFNNSSVLIYYNYKQFGFSVRCVRD